ncbi:MAG: aminotransferase class I/II-fold pyridoxal phosphate-dependent enzyme [Oscillospiraceae bacterium]|nr:aminotransferase class I/II-fold pyridoxal phosphate-dependent enzyme [Oscillospiraceae bacterium]
MDTTQLRARYEQLKSKGLKLDMSRGKPGADVIALSSDMLSLPGASYMSDGIDCRNYNGAILDGLPEAKALFAPMLGVRAEEMILGNNSSLSMMYDTIVRCMIYGVDEKSESWSKYNKGGERIKFLCPVPGYDRHFTICEALGIEMLNIPVSKDGIDMDAVEELAKNDESVKGIWCVPIYSNPTGITYSDDTVRRLARLETKAEDFRIFWDCAYAVHHLNDTPDVLLNILDECKKAGRPDKVYMFASTSKITFPGGGVAIMATSERNAALIKKRLSARTIGSDKLNQLRHVQFLKDWNGLEAHMKAIRGVLQPKFDVVLQALERELSPLGLGKWHKPNGGYFVSFDGNPGTAKKTIQLCRDAGVILTEAGATFPYGNDPDDKNIRIAPSFPPLNELVQAMEVFCVGVKLANL